MAYKKIFTTLPLLYLLIFTSSCRKIDHLIEVIGIDKNGDPTIIHIPQLEYIKRFSRTINAIQKPSLSALSKIHSNSPWQLRAMAFGIGVNAQVGFGPWQIGAYPELRLIFSNSSDSYVP
ncbi:MAG: hypothetical protein ABIQ95_12600 [Bdellovibrionia bacterium]